MIDTDPTTATGHGERNRNTVAVVFLHHFGGSARTWSDVIRRLPDRRCIAPDLRGFGGTSASDGRYELTDYVADVRQLIAEHAIRRFVLVGHSMGGKIAQGVATTEIPGLEALVLLAPSPPTPEPMTDDARNTLATALERHAGAEVVASAIVQPLAPSIVAEAVSILHQSNIGAWYAWVERGSRADISDAVSKIKISTQVLSGCQDSAISTDVVRSEVVGRIPRATLVVVPDCGHLLPLEAPATVANAIRVIANACDARHDTGEVRPESSKAITDGRRLNYPRGAVLWSLDTPDVTDTTRRALLPRLVSPHTRQPRFFTAAEMELFRAVVARLIPASTQAPSVDVVHAVDERLARGKSNGWRYDSMPPDGDAYRRGFAGLNETARAAVKLDFVHADAVVQDRILRLAQSDHSPAGGAWAGVVPSRFFEELLAEVSEIYFSHPQVQDDIGYVGMSDAPGWTHLGLNELEDREPRPVEVHRG